MVRLHARLPRGWQPDLVALAVLCGLGLALRMAFLLRAPAFIVNDSLSYLLPGFDLATVGDFAPIYKRPPGYPAFVGLALWFFGQQSLFGLLLLQHLAGVAIVALAYALGSTLYGRPAGWAAGLLTALSGPLVVTEHYLMSETLFSLLLTATLLVTILALRRRSVGLLALGGLLLGLAALTRPVAQLLLPCIALLALFAWRRWRPALTAAAVLVACYGVTVLPWMARNAAVQGSFTLAGGMGEGLAVRTIRLDQEFDFGPTAAPDPLARERKIFREEAKQGSAYELARRLQTEAGLSPAEADRAMRDIALGAIRSKPLYYVVGSFDMFLRMLAGRTARLRQDWQPWRGIEWEERVAHLLPEATPEQDREFGLAQSLVTIYDPARWAVPVLALFLVGCATAATRRPRLPSLLPPFTALALLLASAYLVGIEWRYRFPLDPLINVTVGGGAVAVWAAAARIVRWLTGRAGRGQPSPAYAIAPAFGAAATPRGDPGERGPAD